MLKTFVIHRCKTLTINVNKRQYNVIKHYYKILVDIVRKYAFILVNVFTNIIFLLHNIIYIDYFTNFFPYGY